MRPLPSIARMLNKLKLTKECCRWNEEWTWRRNYLIFYGRWTNNFSLPKKSKNNSAWNFMLIIAYERHKKFFPKKLSWDSTKFRRKMCETQKDKNFYMKIVCIRLNFFMYFFIKMLLSNFKLIDFVKFNTFFLKSH